LENTINPFTRSPWSILLVDDSAPLIELTRQTLKTYQTLTAANGLEAIEQYRKCRPDLIVMDSDMPEMDGYEACRRIKEICGRRFTPIIFVSEKSDIATLKRGLQSGAEDFLAKPFEPEELMVRVQAALRTKKLYVQMMQAYEIIERERDIIAQIQQDLLCDQLPEIAGLNFFSEYQPSSKAGGDYYDFIQVDPDHLGVLVADVSGHGTPAAVIMAMKRILLRSFLAHIRSPGETLGKINRILFKNLRSRHFITAFYGVIHLPTRRMKYASAGHNPPLLIHYPSGDLRELWADKGFPLMISLENEMVEHEVDLLPDSKLILYTDGLTEARNPEGEAIGSKRLASWLLEFGQGRDARQLGEKILDEVKQFMDGTHFTDDYTLVIVEIE